MYDDIHPSLRHIQNDGFLALNTPRALPVSFPPSRRPIFSCSIVSSFPEGHVVGILQCPSTSFLNSSIFPSLCISVTVTEFTAFLLELKHFLEHRCIQRSLFFTTISSAYSYPWLEYGQWISLLVKRSSLNMAKLSVSAYQESCSSEEIS